MSDNINDKTRWEELVALNNENLELPLEIVDGQGSVRLKRPKESPYWDLKVTSDSITTFELLGK